jgi:hypothetical protein
VTARLISILLVDNESMGCRYDTTLYSGVKVMDPLKDIRYDMIYVPLYWIVGIISNAYKDWWSAPFYLTINIYVCIFK